MKYILLSIALIFGVISTSAQVEFYGKNFPEDLKGTKLAVVMAGSEGYKVQLKDAVEKHWKLSQPEFIDEATFEQYKSNPEYSFLYVQSHELNGYPTDFFTLAIGNKKKSEQPLILKELIVDLKKINADGAPMVHLYVQQIQQYINRVAAGEITDATFSDRVISKGTYRIKEMPLLVREQDFDKTLSDPAKRKEFYSGAMEVVSQDRINDAILDNEQVAVVDIILTGERRNMHCYKRIYDAADGSLLYRTDTESLYEKKQGLIDEDLKSLDRAR